MLNTSKTLLKDLPVLEERSENAPYSKFIRQKRQPLNNSGMVQSHDPNQFHTQIKTPVQQPPTMNYQPSTSKNHDIPSISCIEIVNHIKSCPICSKLYKTDTSIHLIIIVILCIICVLLFKKVMQL